MGKLDGRVALITGGARGQGAAEATLFSREGATVVITDVLDVDGAVTAKGCFATYLHHDVTSEAGWDEVVGHVLAQHGKLDILVNNAGIFKTGGILNTSFTDYKRVIEVNQFGVFLGMKAVAKPMMEAGSGVIVNISSIAGMQGSPGSAAYGASKWAVRGMTKGAASELGRYGIRVNSIHPGLIDTPMLHEVPGIDAGGTDRWLRRIPLGRLAEANEVAKLALFLASDDSSYCTGAEFIVDGGMTAS
ncbi:MAG: SDR family NAD(P)-dependent oxidoreductase [Dehalococcoidia bacterium]